MKDFLNTYALFFSGLGFGLVIASTLILINTPGKTMPTKYEVETLARGYGMVYQDEILSFRENIPQKEIVEKDEKKDEEKETSLGTKIIMIPKGSSSEKIARILFEEELIGEPWDFARRVKELGVSSKLDAGEFEIPLGLPIDEIIDLLVVGERRR